MRVSLSIIAALSISAALAAPGGGGSMPSMDLPSQSPEELARQDYNSGIRALKDAAKQEENMAEAKDAKKAEKAKEKATKSYERALKSFTRAAQRIPTMHDAWNYIGYTERHLGNYQASLAAYAKALELKPNFPEAIEYRGEAFLGLNAVEDAKQAYLSLHRSSRPHAEQLLTAMKAWVAKRKQNPEGVDVAVIDAFANWVSERSATAANSAQVSGQASGAVRW